MATKTKECGICGAEILDPIHSFHEIQKGQAKKKRAAKEARP